MAGDDAADDLVELRPAPEVLLRHRRDADVVVHEADRVGPRVELRRGALWVRAGEDGPGVTVTHGAANVQVRAGAGVIEVSDMEALLVVASGRAAVKGAAPLPRSVLAGQAVALTLDGTFTDPAALTPAELASDRMVVENLARDSLLSAPTRAPAERPSGVAPAPAPAPVPDAPPAETAAEEPAPPPVEAPVPVEPSPDVEIEPEPEPEPDEPGPEVEGEAAALLAPEPAPPTEPEPPIEPEPAPPAEPEPEGEPEPEPAVEPDPAPAVEPAPAGPPAASALEAALAGVGVTDDPSATRVPVDRPVVEGDAADRADGRRRTRTLVVLVIVALLIFALVALLVLGGSGS